MLRLLEYVLYEFDISNSSGKEHPEEQMDKDLIQELYDSFNGFFNRT